MRRADLDVAWRKCRTDRRALSLDSITAVHGDTEVAITTPSRVIAIVGPNGAGKSRLLAELSSLLDRRREHQRVRLSGATGTYRGEAAWTEAEGDGPPVFLLDVSSSSHQAQDFFRRQSALQELLDQYEERRLSDDEMSKFRYVCGKNYTSVGIREIEAPTPLAPQHAEAPEEDEDAELSFPFFEVECDGLTYNSLNMGFGELCAFTVLWWLGRAPRSSVLLLDEPDAHLSPASRAALVDLIALEASDNKHIAMFSTHSAESISKISESEIVAFGDGERRDWLMTAPQRRQLLRALGVCHPVKILIVVEDIDGVELARLCLNRWGIGLSECFDIQQIAGGENEVMEFVRRFPESASIRVQGILDGDMRQTHAGTPNIDFFPGTFDPVATARGRFTDFAESFAAALGVDVALLTAAHVSVAHIDHHDYMHALISALHISSSVAAVRTALFTSWLRLDDVSEDAKALTDRLLDRLASLPV